jgi:hypothetical protein
MTPAIRLIPPLQGGFPKDLQKVLLRECQDFTGVPVAVVVGETLAADGPNLTPLAIKLEVCVCVCCLCVCAAANHPALCKHLLLQLLCSASPALRFNPSAAEQPKGEGGLQVLHGPGGRAP